MAAKYNRRIRNAAFVAEYLKDHPCVDCGEPDIVVLDFDHITLVKHSSIARLVRNRYAISRIKAEIALCEVVCSNCHRRRTARRGGHYRYRISEDE